jgi:hypothetical protein
VHGALRAFLAYILGGHDNLSTATILATPVNYFATPSVNLFFERYIDMK